MYKHILVAIDESANSDLALREAINLAKDQNAVLQLVHVVDLTPVCLTEETPYPYVECQKAMEESGQKILASHATTVREAGIEADSKLITIKQLWVSIYDVIEEQSEQWPADLIVIGTHGRRGFQHARLGSVAEGLIRIATKPVLLIRGPKQKASQLGTGFNWRMSDQITNKQPKTPTSFEKGRRCRRKRIARQ